MNGMPIITITVLLTVFLLPIFAQLGKAPCCNTRESRVSSWQGPWTVHPVTTESAPWTPPRIPIHITGDSRVSRMDTYDVEDEDEARGKLKYKKYKKYMLPLLLAYKLKFFTLIPVLIGGLVLLTGATGLAGFFFALFAATMGLKGGGDH